MRKLLLILILALLSFPLFAQTLVELKNALSNVCFNVTSLLPIAAMLMVVVAGVVYALGQLAGAEMRARTSVWSQAILTGSLIAILIVLIAPPLLSAIYGSEVNCAVEGTSPCPSGQALDTCHGGCRDITGPCFGRSGPIYNAAGVHIGDCSPCG